MLHLIISTILGFIITALALALSNKAGVLILSYLIILVFSYFTGAGILSLFGF